MRRLILIVAFAFAVFDGRSLALTGSLDLTRTGDAVTVSTSSPFADMPPGGALPLRVTIKNDTGGDGTWHFTAVASVEMMGAGGFTYSKDLRVAANTTGSFDLLVPMPVSKDTGMTVLNLRVEGPGFGSSLSRGFNDYVYSNHSRQSSPFAVVGNVVLGPGGAEALDKALKGTRREFYGSGADAAKLPVDWRAYSGVAVLMLQDAEWLALDTAQRDAVSDYVAQGGRLALYTTDNPETRAPQLQLPTGDQPGDYGFGKITLEHPATSPLAPSDLMSAIVAKAAPDAGYVDVSYSNWGLRGPVGAIVVSGAFVMGFVLVFGSLVGPLNLFVFAQGKKRFRLFWTTPLISLVASLALVIGILVTDGLGGHGRQLFVSYSLPTRTRDAVVQEQVARTAVLFGTGWHNDQDYLITPVSDRVLREGNGQHHFGIMEASESYRLQDGNYSGGWFRSRTVSGQYLQAVRPSRAVLTVLNPAGVAAGAAPVVLSSFPNVLDQVFVLDAGQHYWRCSDLAPGRKQTCRSTSQADFNNFWSRACADAGGKLKPMLRDAPNRAGCFYATGATPAAERLGTLGEINWTVARGIYLGPWVASTAPEATP